MRQGCFKLWVQFSHCGKVKRCLQVNGQRGMDEVFAEIDGVLSAFSEDETSKAAAR